MQLVGFIIRVYHHARSPERQNRLNLIIISTFRSLFFAPDNAVFPDILPCI